MTIGNHEYKITNRLKINLFTQPQGEQDQVLKYFVSSPELFSLFFKGIIFASF